MIVDFYRTRLLQIIIMNVTLQNKFRFQEKFPPLKSLISSRSFYSVRLPEIFFALFARTLAMIANHIKNYSSLFLPRLSKAIIFKTIYAPGHVIFYAKRNMHHPSSSVLIGMSEGKSSSSSIKTSTETFASLEYCRITPRGGSRR